jgi:anti-sigma factor RsiW
MARVFQLDSDEHQAAQALLPWYVNGTLPADQLALVQAHLAQCERCQADAAWQQQVRATPPALPPASREQINRQWAALSSQLGTGTGEPSHGGTSLLEWLRLRWLPLGLAAQGALTVAVLALVAFGGPPHEEQFQALGSEAPVAAANALAVFHPGSTEADIRNALRASGAQLVGGPTATDAYLLHVPAPTGASLARLRASGAAARVESLEGATP